MSFGESGNLWFVFAAVTVFMAWVADVLTGMSKRIADIDRRTTDMAYQLDQMRRAIDSLDASVEGLDRNSHPQSFLD